MATTYHVKPSHLLGIPADDDYRAFAIDEACFEWGAYIEGELASVEGKNPKSTASRRQLRLKGLLGESGGFQDPAALMTKKP
jgi:hypothetical protein